MTSRSAPATGAAVGASTWTSSVVSAPGAKLLVGRGHRDVERPARGLRHGQRHRASGEGRPLGRPVDYAAVVGGPRGRPGDLDRHVDVGDVVLADLDGDDRRAVDDVERRRRRHRSVVGDDQPGPGRERRLHQQLRRLAGLVLLGVRDDRERLAVDGAARDCLGAAHPAGRLAATQPSGVVGDGRRDPVGAVRRLGSGGARRRLGRRGHRASCRVEQLIGPFPVDEAAIRPPGDDLHVAGR